MGTPEQRRSERIRITLPILVAGFDSSGEEFTEETHTLVVNREGALIVLKHALTPGNTIRIIQLQNEAAADFRVVGPTRLDTDRGGEWGVEYLQEGRNIWGIDFPSLKEPDKAMASALLECQVCLRKSFWPLTLVEAEVLDSTGMIQNFCDGCRKPTEWAYANVASRPAQHSPSPGVSSAAQPQPSPERRASRRLLMKLPILIRNQKGVSEISKTENLSQGDFAVSLGMNLSVGEQVTAICPYTSAGRNLERNAQVLRRVPATARDKTLYGMRYVVASQAG